ncbi:cyclic nucleotide-binding domain-containing protein [Geminocystis sp. CENA526]|uniref:cyclic nucleotide-binding domain-containing protein n=1 Tax=Geminocystis sp. CENA526 TaxID=1355871 RepID=UPI003D6FAC2A
MFNQTSEKTMHTVRWLLTIGWFVLILSFFWDPFSASLTEPGHPWSPWSINPRDCVEVQGECLPNLPQPMGARLFWATIVPVAIIVLLVLGHETWRRVCPLSFLSQIPRALGIQRKQKTVNPRTGAISYQLAKVKENSWLQKNSLYFQLALFYAGLCMRILFVNSDRLFLGSFLLFTIASAILVGYLYSGKSWCHYFCPMAPVQMFYNGPRALVGSKAHIDRKQTITQSMCRTVDKDGKEKSACVSCNSPCLDIDIEKTYWEEIDRPGRKMIQYSYIGLMVGFYYYYLLYAGNWKYYYSGAWTREPDQVQKIFDPGFYIFGQVIPIPKLIAVPLTLAIFGIASYVIINQIEKVYKAYRIRIKQPQSRQQVLHVIFTLATFVGFNVFFMFGGRPQLRLLPMSLQLIFNGIVVFVSALWVYVTIKRTPEEYSKESLATGLRRQLSKLTIDFSKFLGDRTLEDLNTDEVYVLAKVLPNFSKDQGLQVYKGLLKESLEEGKVSSSDSLEMLRQVRFGLGIKDEEHYNILTELGIENPQLLDPTVLRSRENLIRLESYREALEIQLLDCIEKGLPLQEILNQKNQQIQSLRLEYGITDKEENQILEQMFSGDSAILHTAENLLNQLSNLIAQQEIFDAYFNATQLKIIAFVRQVTILNKQELIVKKLLSIIEILGDNPNALKIAKNTNSLASDTILKMFEDSSKEIDWQSRYSSSVWASLSHNPADDPSPMSELPTGLFLDTNDEDTKNFLLDSLRDLITDFDPLIRAASLMAIKHIVPKEAEAIALSLKDNLVTEDWLLTEVVTQILTPANNQSNPEAIDNYIKVKLHSGGKVEEFTFTQPLIRIGSSSINDLVIDGMGISPQHALLYLGEDEVNIIELGTAVGLTINGKTIKDTRYPLNQGEKVFFGLFNDLYLEINWQNLSSVSQTTDVTTLDKLLLLWDNSFFSSIEINNLVELAHSSHIHNYPQGEIICQQDTLSDAIFLLLEGSADVMITDTEDTEKLIKVSEIKAGETIGEMGVITKQKRSAWVISASPDAKLLVIQAQDFENVLRDSQQLLRNLITILSDRVRNLTSKVNE